MLKIELPINSGRDNPFLLQSFNNIVVHIVLGAASMCQTINMPHRSTELPRYGPVYLLVTRSKVVSEHVKHNVTFNIFLTNDKLYHALLRNRTTYKRKLFAASGYDLMTFSAVPNQYGNETP